MLRTGNAGVRPREMALPEKRRCGVAVERINNSGFSRFLLLCFAAGCHTFGLKIATAALRPRNDTNLKRFCFGNGRFCFMRPFRAETLRTVFQAFRSENRFVFQQILSDLSLRGGRIFAPDAVIFDGTRRHPGTRRGRTAQ